MAKILLGVTGSVAAIKMEELATRLTNEKHELKIVMTNHSKYFVSPEKLEAICGRDSVFTDASEWPNQLYSREDNVLHIELRKWAGLFIIAPLDANTLGKMALGLADNCLTSIWRARDIATPVILAPAMNTLMWQKPATLRHLTLIAEENGLLNIAPSNPDHACEIINLSAKNLRVLQPEEKLLACGDLGVGAMSSIEKIVEASKQLLSL
jgi:phosphopantothenoylcysteine decarboxylase